MNEHISVLIKGKSTPILPAPPLFLSIQEASKIQKYHASFPQYHETPLVTLDNLAKSIGVGGVYVKDESYRFGLNAFKALGGSYAIGKFLAQKLGLPSLEYGSISSLEAKKQLGDLTFITTTDGNHGRGVAWTSTVLGFKSVVYMPKGSATERVENIRKSGAVVTVLPMNYDDAVRYSKDVAEQNGWILMQDTAFDGYEKIPTWIMQGYMTMAYEVYRQLEQMNESRPTHLFLQAGVGSMAAAVLGFFANAYGEYCPKTVIVEPTKADCFFRTAQANDGKLHAVTDDMNTIMAGLACGEPNPLAWDIIVDHAVGFASCPDYVTAKGMRILGNPLGEDCRVISGESGAVGIGLIVELMTNPELAKTKEQLGLDHNSRVLCFSTEGDTDKAGYRSVVWDGTHPSSE